MELNLIVPVTNGEKKKIGDEEILGKLWRVIGPHDIRNLENLRFYCVSYVWGSGLAEEGSFFNNQIKISDQTRPALTAAIKAAGVLPNEPGKPIVEAFWIDAICIPQLEPKPRLKTLESMGFIYSAAISVIIVLQESIWNIIQSVSSKVSPRALTHKEMHILEEDIWISRVWTYQELVNGREAFFSTLAPEAQGHAIHAEKFLNCVGFSLSQWKRIEGKGHGEVLEAFPKLNTLEDTLADRQMGMYLDRVALKVVSNMAVRTFDPKFPQNRLLACMGALTQEVSWGPASATLEELAEKLMAICESNNDYSFIYTSDIRNRAPGMRWRPSPFQSSSNGPTHLVPVVNWNNIWGTQNGHRDARGFWLDKMVLLNPAETIDEKAKEGLERMLYGYKDLKEPNKITGWVFRRQDYEDKELSQVVLKYLGMAGFKGDREPHVCESGLFFSQSILSGRDSVEMYATAGIRWTWGSPGLARWKEDGEIMYCAGVFTGVVKMEAAEPLLVE